MNLMRKIRKNMYDIKEMTYVSSLKKSMYKYGAMGTIIVSVTILCVLPPFLAYSETIVMKRQTFPTDLKYILFWTATQKKVETKSIKTRYEINREPRHYPGQLLFINQKCPYINCYITYNKTLLDSQYFDAVVFDVREIMHVKDNDINLTRTPNQKYIFRSLQPSEYSPVCHEMFEGFFNWTWTYKLNSDIPQPFVNIYNDRNVHIGPEKNITWLSKMNRTGQFVSKIKSKTKPIAWLIDKCKLKSKHRDFIDELQKELLSYNYSIDTFGPCGKRPCPPGEVDECLKVIERTYFFQLVLEESTSVDYVTERLSKVMSYLMIPVVSGEVDYNRFLAPGTYISTKFFNIKKLVAVIYYLMRNPKVYEYFFDWKNHYRYASKPRNYMCDICAKLNNQPYMEEHKTYNRFREWWNPGYKETCKRLQLYRLFTKKDVL